MNIAYLSNQYPTTSHSFIRREIRALEDLGDVQIHRFSIRSTKGSYVDPEDELEASKTKIVLRDLPSLAAATSRVSAKHPSRFATALRTAGRFASESDRGWVPHLAYLAEACVLYEALSEAKVSHVHAHFGTNSAAVAALCRTLGGPPYSFTVHGPEEFDRAPVLAMRDKILGASFVAAISEYGRSQLCRMVPRDHWNKIHVIRCGLQRELLTRQVRPIQNPARFVCVGRLHEQKGHFVLLEAAAELVREARDFRLVLAGDGPLRSVIEARIAELGLAPYVSITGWLTQQQVLDQLDDSAALVLPSFAEGLPVVMMEAFALGRPVISTYVAGIPELVEPGVNGWLVPAGSVSALVDAMAQALETSPDRLIAMGLQGKSAVQRQHDVVTSARALRELMEKTSP